MNEGAAGWSLCGRGLNHMTACRYWTFPKWPTQLELLQQVHEQISAISRRFRSEARRTRSRPVNPNVRNGDLGICVCDWSLDGSASLPHTPYQRSTRSAVDDQRGRPVHLVILPSTVVVRASPFRSDRPSPSPAEDRTNAASASNVQVLCRDLAWADRSTVHSRLATA